MFNQCIYNVVFTSGISVQHLCNQPFLFLQSGKHCLCRYMLPSCVSEGQFSHNLEFPETSVTQGLKVIGLADAVEGRINVTVNNGKVSGFLISYVCSGKPNCCPHTF